MVILGLLLVLGAVGVSVAAFMYNEGAFAASAGFVDLFGSRFELTNGQVFLAGVAAGAVTLLGLFMMFGGAGRSARRRAVSRAQQRELEAARAAEVRHDVKEMEDALTRRS